MKINNNLIHKILAKIPLKYITLILAIMGVFFLYALSLLQQPIVLTTVDSLEEYNGKEVTLTGTILDYSNTRYGSQLITIQCNSTKVTVFSETPLSFFKGDIIQATGTIQEYKNTWELILSNPKAATIQTTWQNKTTTIKDIADHPQDYLNIPLNITGYVDMTYDSIIYLKDSVGNYTIPLIPRISSTPPTGSYVYTHATLTYDPTHIRYILTDCKTIQQIPSESMVKK
jgi:hypothetical protein